MSPLFLIFALLTVVPTLLMVVSRNTVNGAMFMILSFVGMASLFVLLDAYFLAILQILVYAGAIMVLFLFIIMLLDMRETEKIRPKTVSLLAALVSLALLLVGVFSLSGLDFIQAQTASGLAAAPEFPGAENPMEFATRTKAFGFGLFTKYMLPLQVTGFLLLVAMIGVIVVSKKYEDSAGYLPERGQG